MAFNRATVLGRVGQEVKLQQAKSGHHFCELSLATNSRKKRGDEYVEHVEWHHVIFWGKSANILADYVNKGDQLLVDGELETNSWEGSCGKKHYKTRIVGRNFSFVGGNNTEGREAKPKSVPASQSIQTRKPEQMFDDDDIPF